MAIKYIDSFSHYATLSQKGWTTNTTIVAGGGRWGGDAVRVYSDTHYLQRSVAQMTTWYMGAAFLPNGTGTYQYIFVLYDGSTVQAYLNIALDGTIRAYNGSSSTPIGQSTLRMSRGVYHYIDAKITIDNSAGVVLVTVDGVEFLNLTGEKTQNSANAYASIFRPLSIGNAGTDCYCTDLYVDDAENHGDVRVAYLKPTADSATYKQWTRSTGLNNWDLVDEDPPVTTDYVYAANANTIDSYTTENLASNNGTIKAVAVNLYCYKDDAGNKEVAGFARLSGNDQAGNTMAVPSSYGFLQSFVSRPGGGSWNVADINNAEFGQKVIS